MRSYVSWRFQREEVERGILRERKKGERTDRVDVVVASHPNKLHLAGYQASLQLQPPLPHQLLALKMADVVCAQKFFGILDLTMNFEF